jgi:hypothetical protein
MTTPGDGLKFRGLSVTRPGRWWLARGPGGPGSRMDHVASLCPVLPESQVAKDFAAQNLLEERQVWDPDVLAVSREAAVAVITVG